MPALRAHLERLRNSDIQLNGTTDGGARREYMLMDAMAKQLGMGMGNRTVSSEHVGATAAQFLTAGSGHLKLDLRGHSPRPLPLPGKCAAELTKDGCTASIGAGACDRCAGAHQSDLKAAGCTRTFVKDFCAKPSGAD